MTRVAIAMPKLGYDMESGRLAAWTKKVGDAVERGEVIAEIETDKATVEMEATAAGTLVEILLDPGGEAPVGSTIAFVEVDAGNA